MIYWELVHSANDARSNIIGPPKNENKVTKPHLNDVRQSLEELLELGVPVVRDPALPAEVVVVTGDELVELHSAAYLGLQEVHQLAGKEGELKYKFGGDVCLQTFAPLTCPARGITPPEVGFPIPSGTSPEVALGIEAVLPEWELPAGETSSSKEEATMLLMPVMPCWICKCTMQCATSVERRAELLF